MKNDTLSKARVAQKQVHYLSNAQKLHEKEIVRAIAKKNQNKQTVFEIDGDELIEYSLNKKKFTRWIVFQVDNNQVILLSI
ncbi:hypothetical protein BKI52_08660 [marine bacterium AO1-C]|nr:hypothetical protein BKI52_08660 [marine bacterium AO1-C]